MTTSESARTTRRPRFPIWLTLAAVVGFAICCGLGAWQLQRAAWKAEALKQIAALKGAAPAPISQVLTDYLRGADASFRRVAVDCAPGSATAPYRLTTDNGEWIARAQALCRLPDAGYVDILVDRGFLSSSRGATSPPTTVLPPPRHLEGVLYRNADDRYATRSSRAPFLLVVERETPPAPGVTVNVTGTP